MVLASGGSLVLVLRRQGHRAGISGVDWVSRKAARARRRRLHLGPAGGGVPRRRQISQPSERTRERSPNPIGIQRQSLETGA